MNYILREIKLSNITGVPLSDDVTKLVEFWDGLWVDMKVVIDAEKGEIKCWKENYNYYYFYQKNKKATMWCNHRRVWSFFINELKLNHTDTQEVTQYMLGETLKSEVSTPQIMSVYELQKLGKTLKSEVSTPQSFH